MDKVFRYKGVTLTQRHVDLFWDKVVLPTSQDECWYWDEELYSVSTGGYGRVNFMGHIFHSNQLAYLFYYGEIDEDKIILHSKTCIENAELKFGDGKKSRLCCNPTHLRQGTYKENNNDTKNQGRMKGLYAKGHISFLGESHPGHKLTSKDVENIKKTQEPTNPYLYHMALLNLLLLESNKV